MAVDFRVCPKQSGWLINQLGVPQFLDSGPAAGSHGHGGPIAKELAANAFFKFPELRVGTVTKRPARPAALERPRPNLNRDSRGAITAGAGGVPACSQIARKTRFGNQSRLVMVR